jgi:hypothetical protein
MPTHRPGIPFRMFPDPLPVATQPCAKCRQPVQLGNLVAGRFGWDCATKLGLLGKTTDTGQTGPTLFDQHEGDDLDGPEDHCDGHDR